MIAIDQSPAGYARTAVDAIEAFANPKAAFRRRKAERAQALARGRKAIARLKQSGAETAAHPPHLSIAIAAIETLEAAVLSLDAISQRLSDALELVHAAETDIDGAAADGEDGTRALLAERYDELRDDITRIAGTAYAGRTNLLDGLGGELDVPLDPSGRSRAVILGVNAVIAGPDNPGGLDLPPPALAFATSEERVLIAQAVSAALHQTAAFAARFEVDAALVAAKVAESR